ncbi:MAG: hypothetical protein R2874_09255 [Desulfobacterales bacterium]
MSCEILRQDAWCGIYARIWSKILDYLDQMAPEDYEKFYAEFRGGAEGRHPFGLGQPGQIAKLARFKTTKIRGQMGLSVKRMSKTKPDQEDIYYITEIISPPFSTARISETLKEKDFEVLLMTDPVDEFVIQSMPEFEKEKIQKR